MGNFNWSAKAVATTSSDTRDRITSSADSSSTDALFRDLLEQTRRGFQRAAWQLLETFGPHIRAVVRRRLNPSLRSQFDSEDFVQAVWASFIRISPRLHKIDRPEHLVALLATIARNKVIDEARRQMRSIPLTHRPSEAQSTISGPHELIAKIPTPSQFAIAREKWQQLVDGLSVRHQAILEMRLGGATYQTIADKLDMHEGSIRRIIKRLSETKLN